MNRRNANTTGAVRAALAAGAAVAAMVGLFVSVLPPAQGDVAEAALTKYNKRVDDAIDQALAFLAKSQGADGFFASPMGKNTAVTALSVMAFLSKGHTPGTGPYGQVINKGIDAILASVKERGLIANAHTHGPFGYDHCIATLMLSEVSGMVDPARQKRIDEVLPQALKLILTAQEVKKNPWNQGGWRYQPQSNDSDISCTGWALMTLRSARNSGSQIPKEAIQKGLEFILHCRCPDGGFAYEPGGGSGLARTGTGLLCLELCGRHNDEAAKGAGNWILKNLPRTIGHEFFYYGLYYCSQGMFQLGGEYWEKFAAHMYETMLQAQQKDGSWPQGGGNEGSAGTCYSTAMGVLAMGVSYRQLPIYQR